MPYATLEQIRLAAGGTTTESKYLEEISRGENADVIARAQVEADAWIDAVTRRINSAAVPWDPADAPQISTLAAAEVVYILRVQSNVAVQRHDDAHAERKLTLEGIAAGLIMPSSTDDYPVGTGGGGPVSGTRTLTTTEIAAGINDRCSLKGLW
jgi:hypothetical protein